MLSLIYKEKFFVETRKQFKQFSDSVELLCSYLSIVPTITKKGIFLKAAALHRAMNGHKNQFYQWWLYMNKEKSSVDNDKWSFAGDHKKSNT